MTFGLKPLVHLEHAVLHQNLVVPGHRWTDRPSLSFQGFGGADSRGGFGTADYG